MLDILSFFKKKQKQPPAAEEKEAAQQSQVKIDDKVAIHVMPEHFRNRTVKINSAKKTGMIIIFGGAAVLLVVSAALYYFLFSLPKKAPAPAEQAEVTNNQPVAPAEEPAAAATSAETAILPSESEAATSTAATSTPETASSTAPISYSFGLDTDQDGLTDKEETLLGTSPLNTDSDGDGYPDGAELISLYDPAGKGKLIDNPAIALYENKTFNYNLIYPRAFKTSSNGGDDSIMFKTDDNQFIQAIVQPNINKQILEAWYLDQLGVLLVNENDRVNEAGWQGIKSPDGLTLYLMDNKQNYIFSLSYNLGGGNIMEYADIYKMMVKSFTLKD